MIRDAATNVRHDEREAALGAQDEGRVPKASPISADSVAMPLMVD